MTLTEFLKARLDADEQAAKAWLPFGNPDEAARAHVARHDPGRALAEVDAKRQQIEQVLNYEALGDGECGCCHEGEQIGAGLCPMINPDEIPALRLLALPYAGHPDYDESWRP